ncbi:YcaO-like family protein [Paenibacillus taichungensis]
MLYMSNPIHFNIPEQKFITDDTYTSFSRIGNFLKNGYIGPDSSTAIDFSKHQSVIKAYSEMIERRAISAGGIPFDEENVHAVNMINSKSVIIDKKYSTYSLSGEFPIDTTGASSHISSEKAVINSLREIIEKNALYLFWYGKKGCSIKMDISLMNQHKLLSGLINQDKEVLFFINDFFCPLKVVFCFIIFKNFVCASGVGTSFSVEEAVFKSVQEAVLLQWKDESNELVSMSRQVFKKRYEDHSEYIEYLSRGYGSISLNEYKDNTATKNITVPGLLSVLPSWILDLYMIPLKQTVTSKVKCVKIYSPYLFNHIPLKEYINLRNPMNVNTINLDEQSLLKIPNCIVT